MRGEGLRELREVQSDDWATFYVVTDNHCYEYTGQSFIASPLPATAATLELPSDYAGTTIEDVRGDGESAVLRLDNGGLIVFELGHDPFGGQVESYPRVRFVSRDEAKTWQSEYDDMDSI